MSIENLRVPRPRVISIQRVHPGRFSIGDAALVRFAPGLLRFLNLRDSQGERIGNAFAPEWINSLGAAATAAASASQEHWGWMGISLSVDWIRACKEDEYLLAKSTIESIIPSRFGKVSLVHSYEVVSEKTKDLLARGKMVLASAHPEAIKYSVYPSFQSAQVNSSPVANPVNLSVTPVPIEEPGKTFYVLVRDEREMEAFCSEIPDGLSGPHINLDIYTIDELNEWFDRQMANSTGPGIKVIAALIDAVITEDQLKTFSDVSIESIEKLEKHLEYVGKHYPKVRIATASEALSEYIDRCSPTLKALVTNTTVRSLDGRTLILPIRILGQGVPPSQSRPVTLSVFPPRTIAAENVKSLVVLENGQPIASTEPSPGDFCPIEFLTRSKDGYELIIQLRKSSANNFGFNSIPALSPLVLYEETPEFEREDLFRLEQPRLLKKNIASNASLTNDDSWEWLFPASLFRLLINPIGGGTEPLARRAHPFGFLSLAAAIHGAIHLFKEVKPVHADVRWLHPVAGRSDFRLIGKLKSYDDSNMVLENLFFEADVQVAQVKLILLKERPDSLR